MTTIPTIPTDADNAAQVIRKLATGSMRPDKLEPGDVYAMAYRLRPPDRKFRDAVLQVVTAAEDAAGVKVMRGRP